MELEFDKEIDALLRRKLSDPPHEARAPVGSHMNADELAAFAENAMPPATRANYTAHLADCGPCRKMLAGFVSLGSEAAAERAFAAAAAPVAAARFPWYRQLLAMPNLAYVMGVLVLVFAGSLGYLVIQNRNMNRGTEVSQVASEPRVNGPSASQEAPEGLMSTANSAASAANANTASNAMPSISRSGVAVGTSNAVPADEDRNAPAAAAIDSVAAQPAAGSPPAPLKDADAPMERDVKPDRAEEENYALNAQEKKRSDDARAIREMPKTGPSRATGPRNVQNQQNVQDSNLGMRQAEALAKSKPAVSPNLRTAGGKKFEQRGGVWYDTAYRGQGTKTIRRGTEDYIRLDGGLRSIADSLGGTVVLVWNNKAYRIH